MYLKDKIIISVLTIVVLIIFWVIFMALSTKIYTVSYDTYIDEYVITGEYDKSIGNVEFVNVKKRVYFKDKDGKYYNIGKGKTFFYENNYTFTIQVSGWRSIRYQALNKLRGEKDD